MMSKGPVLVTGGAGYIGSHTCKALAAAGYQPVVFDNLSTGNAHAVKWGPLHEGDLRDTERLVGVLSEVKPLAVIHFAALSLVGESVSDPGLYYSNNVAGTLSLLQAMVQSGNHRIVFSSTAATYGAAGSEPLREDAPTVPVNPYGRSKLAIEGMLRDFETAHGMRHVVLRYFNACGADPEAEIGEEHEPETHLIPNLLRAITGDLAKFQLFGEDYDTPDGTCIRDYIHVMDLAAGHIRALEHLIKDGESVTCNLGTGRGHSVREITDAAGRITNREIPMTVVARRAGDPPHLCADVSRAREVLGFVAERSDLDTIIADAWRFHVARKERALNQK